jgi:hypothetical protein
MERIAQEYDDAIAIEALTEHPENPRRGDDSAVAESVETNGFFGAVLVQRSTGYVLAGNTRLRVASADGDESIPGFWLDVDDETAKRILLADNRVSDLAYYDDAMLLSLLESVSEETGSLVGTGYDTSAMELLMQAAAADEIMGGVRQGMTPQDRADEYQAADIRSIILPYSGEEYDAVVDGLIALRQEMDLESNAAVVAKLVLDITAHAE